jgi:hypothetical protein
VFLPTLALPPSADHAVVDEGQSKPSGYSALEATNAPTTTKISLVQQRRASAPVGVKAPKKQP